MYLGLDCSTQGLKATLVDAAGRVVGSYSVHYDTELAQYGTRGGCHEDPATGVATVPAALLADAVGMLLGKMAAAGAPLDRVAAVSGSGQQHGSVYLTAAAPAALAALRGPLFGAELTAAGAFAAAHCPMWRDSSTTLQCEALEAAYPGGAAALAAATGSRAYTRFTGVQVRRRWSRAPSRGSHSPADPQGGDADARRVCRDRARVPDQLLRRVPVAGRRCPPRHERRLWDESAFAGNAGSYCSAQCGFSLLTPGC
jgi:sugar (pentulose or hexulose) kinase